MSVTGLVLWIVVSLMVLAFLGLIVEIVDELKGIRKALETIVRSVSVYEIKDNS